MLGPGRESRRGNAQAAPEGRPAVLESYFCAGTSGGRIGTFAPNLQFPHQVPLLQPPRALPLVVQVRSIVPSEGSLLIEKSFPDFDAAMIVKPSPAASTPTD